MNIVQDFDTKVTQFSANSSEHLTDLRSVPATTTVKSPVILNNVLSQSAILMCFITNRASRNGFCVCFEPSNDLARYEYKTVRGDGSSGRMLHMYLWTKDSSLFKDENSYNKVAAYASGSGNELDAGFEEMGWIVTLASKTQALQVCKPIIFEGLFNREVMS